MPPAARPQIEPGATQNVPFALFFWVELRLPAVMHVSQAVVAMADFDLN